MAARRPKGSGTLTQRKDGVWVGRIDAGWTPHGTRRRLTVSSKSKATAQAKLRDLARQVASGDTPAAGSARITVKAWSEVWLTMHAAAVRPTTYTTDAGAVRKWIVPTIGHRRLADLTPADLRALKTAILGAGRSSTTALHAHKTLLVMLKAAVVEGHTVPARIKDAPRPERSVNDRDAIPIDQALAILEVATARPDSPRWVSALLQGMRQGESLGLRWQHVDLDKGTIDVSWQLQEISPTQDRPDRWEEVHLTGALYLTRPKTERGRRIIPLVPWMTAALVQARDEWTPNPWGLVWTDEGMPIRRRADRDRWREIQALAGVKHPSGRAWHLHEMRHSTVSLLLEAGVDRAVIEALVGHATLVRAYAHVDQGQARRALEAVAQRLALTADAEPPP